MPSTNVKNIAVTSRVSTNRSIRSITNSIGGKIRNSVATREFGKEITNANGEKKGKGKGNRISLGNRNKSEN
jgi:hypothetical protein